MRIAVLTNAFLPHAGGSRLYYYNLFKRMAAIGDEISILTPKFPGWQEFDKREQNAQFHIRRSFHSPLEPGYTQFLKLLGPLLVAFLHVLRRRPDLLHCGDLYPCAVVGLVIKRVFGIPFVAYCHGEDITLTDQRRYQPKLRDLIYRSAGTVIANGDFAVENLKRIGVPSEKIVKITPGLDSSIFFPLPPDDDLRKRFGITDQVVLLTVARLAARKGHAHVLRALASLRSELPPVRYIIAGRGQLEAELRQLVHSLGLEEVVVFAGFVPEDQLNAFYNLADVVVMPNTEVAGDVEGFGMVFLEAGAAAKPVIGGRSGGTGEAVADGVTGLLVNPEHREELNDAIRSLVRDRQLRDAMGNAGLARVRADFAWDTRARRLHDVSSAVLSRGALDSLSEQQTPAGSRYRQASSGRHLPLADTSVCTSLEPLAAHNSFGAYPVPGRPCTLALIVAAAREHRRTTLREWPRLPLLWYHDPVFL